MDSSVEATSQELTYLGLEHLDGSLPRERETWPKFDSRRTLDASGDFYDIAMEEVREYAESHFWVWPERTTFFLSDLHADPDAFLRSLIASGGVDKTGPAPDDFELTAAGRDGVFVIGGDCFDKGPSNLGLLRAMRLLLARGAEVDLLAGNHDVRALVGLEYIGRKESWLAHLFIRMGKKSIPLFKEIYDEFVAGGDAPNGVPSEDELRKLMFPDADWFVEFPKAVVGLLPPKKIDKEVSRIREKIGEFDERRLAVGLTLGMIFASVEQARKLFLDPHGEFFWFFDRMRNVRRDGSFLFVHAGVDDVVAAQLRHDGVDVCNERFKRLMSENLFELYHGPIGNTFRTKYRDSDMPFTERGVRDMHAAGIHAIVHGHRNIPRGQRIVLRNGFLNFECDTTVDRNTRELLGLDGVGGGATVLEPNGRITGISTDYRYAKTLNVKSMSGMSVLDSKRRRNGGGKMAAKSEKNPNNVQENPEQNGAREKFEKCEVKFENTLSVEEAVSYFEAIVEGLKKGSINLKRGERDVTLSPTSHVTIEMKAVRKKKKEGISFDIFWRMPEAELTISTS